MGAPSLAELKRRYPDIRPDFTIEQNWDGYSDEEHAVWRVLYRRMQPLVAHRACDEYLTGLKTLPVIEDRIPNLDRVSDSLEKLTGWRIVAVPSLVPDEIFFAHLANRRFPAGRFIRAADQLDYIEEPDIFHDFFGHVPMLAHPVFADYMQAYGKGGMRALNEFHMLTQLARLYWYTVEFGLLQTPKGLRIYGSGILSSHAETLYALDSPSPNRILFDLERVMCTDYRIDDFQESYFVIESFERLFRDTYQDFAALYERLKRDPTYRPADVLPSDTVIHRGDHSYKSGSHVPA
jgi:phenylalanine-4-hydroxylase